MTFQLLQSTIIRRNAVENVTALSTLTMNVEFNVATAAMKADTLANPAVTHRFVSYVKVQRTCHLHVNLAGPNQKSGY